MSPQHRPKGQRAQNPMRLFFVIFAVVALAGGAWVAYSLLGRDRGVATQPVELEGLDDARSLVERAQGIGLGDPDAPVRILEFADYQCPACRDFALRVKPLLEEQFIRDGTAYLVYYDFPLGSFPHSFVLARGARCAGDQDQFWEYQASIYAEQDRFRGRTNVIGDLLGFARELAMDQDAFESCLRSDRFADVVSANRLLGERLGVGGTPTVIVNGRRLRNPMDFSELRTTVEAEAQAARQQEAGE